MSYENIVITAMSGFLGAAIGSVTTLWLHFKNRKDDERKILNESIHYLLEVFFLVSRLNYEKMTRAYLDYLLKQAQKIDPKLNEENLNFINNQIKSIVKSNSVPLAQKQTFENLKTIGKDYENMLAKLATILPIDAFYLRGKDKLETFMDMASSYFEKVQVANFENKEIIRDVVNQMQPSLITDLIDEYKDDLKTELLILLGMTDRFNSKKGKNAIEKMESVELTEKEKRDIDSMIITISNQFMGKVFQ